MRVLVTGGAGFIGSHIVEAYLALGHEVFVVDDLSTGRAERVPPEATLFKCDVRRPELSGLFESIRPEIVNHQAARANVRESMEKPILYADVNVIGSLNLLECCRRYGTRKVIYASTGGAVYGEPRVLPVPEDHQIEPLDPYGASKHHVEHYLSLYRAQFNIDYTILRYPNVYGPRQDPKGEAGVVAIFIGKLLAGETPAINGSGEQERDFVFISDVVKANVAALNDKTTGIFNIGSGIGTSVNTIFALLSDILDFQMPAAHNPPKPGEVFRIFLDSTRARSDLRWEPEITLEDGLKRTVASFSEDTCLEAGRLNQQPNLPVEEEVH